MIVDEAYIDFAGRDASAVPLIKEYGNICVMQTLSKSFGLAAIRCAKVVEDCGIGWTDLDALGSVLRWHNPH